MYCGKKVIVVMPAYNAERTLVRTYKEVMEQGVVDLVVLVDDKSRDNTAKIANTLPNVLLHVHAKNLGYGGNQKTCYRLALENGADIIVMVHPDYQYTPKLIPAMVSMIANGLHPCILGSRILGGYALRSGMPWWKYIANRCLTVFQNILMGAKLSEYHTGYRAYSKDLLLSLNLGPLSNDFAFDNQFLAQVLWKGNTIGEVSCPTKYFAEASSIDFNHSCRYGLSCLTISMAFFAARHLRFTAPAYLQGDKQK